MKTYKVVFYVVVAIFSATALMSLIALAIVLFGLPGHENIQGKYFDKLFSAIIIETAIVIFALFRVQFLSKKGRLQLAEDEARIVRFRFDIKDRYDIELVPNFPFSAKLRDSKGKQKAIKSTLFHDNGLCSDIEIKDYKQTLSVIIEINGKKYQGSDWLETKTIILKSI